MESTKTFNYCQDNGQFAGIIPAAPKPLIFPKFCWQIKLRPSEGPDIRMVHSVCACTVKTIFPSELYMGGNVHLTHNFIIHENKRKYILKREGVTGGILLCCSAGNSCWRNLQQGQ